MPPKTETARAPFLAACSGPAQSNLHGEEDWPACVATAAPDGPPGFLPATDTDCACKVLMYPALLYSPFDSALAMSDTDCLLFRPGLNEFDFVQTLSSVSRFPSSSCTGPRNKACPVSQGPIIYFSLFRFKATSVP